MDCDYEVYEMDYETVLAFEEEAENEDFPDDWFDEVGYNPYEGCYDWDC